MPDTAKTGQNPGVNTPVRHMRISDEVWNRARETAADQGESVAQFVNQALRAYIADPNAVKAALATIRGAGRLTTPDSAEKDAGCMVPDCDQPVVVLLANDQSFTSARYAERWVCLWHKSNPFPDGSES